MEQNKTYELNLNAPGAFAGKRCYSVEELQDILGFSRPSVYNLINQNVFRCVKVGGKYRISKKSFDEWLDENK